MEVYHYRHNVIYIVINGFIIITPDVTQLQAWFEKGGGQDLFGACPRAGRFYQVSWYNS